MSQKWSRDKVLAELRRLHQRGEPLNSNYAQQNRRPLYLAACTYLGSWRKAIEATGMSYDDVRIQKPKRRIVWSQEIVIQAIEDLNQKGEPLNSNYIQKKHWRLYNAACKYFGSWSQAIMAAGIEYASIRKVEHRSWSADLIVQEVLRRSRYRLSIRGGDVAREDEGLYNAAARYLGQYGWAKARVLAGFDPIDPRPDRKTERVGRKWTERTVTEEIQKLDKVGVMLNTGALKKSNYLYIYSAGCTVFGTWKKAIEAAGLDYATIRKGRITPWTKEEVIVGIKNLENRGVRLSSKATQRSYGPLFAASVTLFGCWSEAVEAAGISYRTHCRTWSTKAWLRRMQNEEYHALLAHTQRHVQRKRRP